MDRAELQEALEVVTAELVTAQAELVTATKRVKTLLKVSHALHGLVDMTPADKDAGAAAHDAGPDLE